MADGLGLPTQQPYCEEGRVPPVRQPCACEAVDQGGRLGRVSVHVSISLYIASHGYLVGTSWVPHGYFTGPWDLSELTQGKKG